MIDGIPTIETHAHRMRVIYSGGDSTNPTLILRIRSFLKAGLQVQSFTFRRKKFNTAFQPEWTNIHLGTTTDRNYFFRVWALLRACVIIVGHRQAFRDADVIYARMFDSALLGLFGRAISGSKAKLVYEIEDVQEVFFKKTWTGATFRWLERVLLKRSQLVVLMSPGFLRGYLAPVQSYDGPTFILENKLQLPTPVPPAGPSGDQWRSIRGHWVIGWYGTLRCERSMKILGEIADRLGDRVHIHTRGYPTETGLEKYRELISRHRNWSYEGEYTIPQDLEEMYGCVHFSWCLDFLDPDGNSPLLLACRMYQGGYYGAIPLVAEGTEMSRFLSAHGIGHAFEEPLVETICDFLLNLSWDDYEQERNRVRRLGPDIFLETGRDVQNMLAVIEDLPAI